MHRQNFLYNGCSISYSDTGQGKIVVLLHGFAETGEVWEKQSPFLQNHYRVIVPEIPGINWQHSQNSGDEPEKGCLNAATSIDAMGDAVAALIQSITADPVIVLGHSMGGYIMLALAENHPHLLKVVGLIHSTAFADTEEKRETRRKGIAFIQKHGAEAFLQTSAPGLFSEQSRQQHPEWIANAIQMGSPFAPEVLVANYEAMIARPDRTGVLRGSKLPVLFIIGMEDKAAPPVDLLKQVYLPEVSYFHLLQHVGHMGMWEAADDVNTFIQKFIEDCG